MSRNAVRKVVSPAGRAYDNPPYCFSYGYNSEADGGSAALVNPTASLIEHGNFDVVTGGIVWDSKIADRTIPASYFLASKPTWFGNLEFPPIDPSRPNVAVTSIPAGYRYVNGEDPAAGTDTAPAAPTNLQVVP
jgi:hypothetical protein